MGNRILKTTIRTKFTFMSKGRASKQIERVNRGYRRLSDSVDPESGSQAVLVPKMLGVDEDMRHWSYFMILEHNTIVNRSITSIVDSLIRGEQPQGEGAIDPKRDVMPSRQPGVEQIDAFADSVAAHLRAVSAHRSLRRSPLYRHPIFGDFNAHQWHCMFGLHLLIHYKQAKYVTDTAIAG